jgi:hypothetical protein
VRAATGGAFITCPPVGVKAVSVCLSTLTCLIIVGGCMVEYAWVTSSAAGSTPTSIGTCPTTATAVCIFERAPMGGGRSTAPPPAARYEAAFVNNGEGQVHDTPL